ncbi:MAG TPA: hypothetical protein VFZ18_05165 [Longimicrobiaceae bacterium]
MRRTNGATVAKQGAIPALHDLHRGLRPPGSRQGAAVLLVLLLLTTQISRHRSPG